MNHNSHIYPHTTSFDAEHNAYYGQSQSKIQDLRVPTGQRKDRRGPERREDRKASEFCHQTFRDSQPSRHQGSPGSESHGIWNKRPKMDREDLREQPRQRNGERGFDGRTEDRRASESYQRTFRDSPPRRHEYPPSLEPSRNWNHHRDASQSKPQLEDLRELSRKQTGEREQRHRTEDRRSSASDSYQHTFRDPLPTRQEDATILHADRNWDRHRDAPPHVRDQKRDNSLNKRKREEEATRDSSHNVCGQPLHPQKRQKQDEYQDAHSAGPFLMISNHLQRLYPLSKGKMRQSDGQIGASFPLIKEFQPLPKTAILKNAKES